MKTITTALEMQEEQLIQRDVNRISDIVINAINKTKHELTYIKYPRQFILEEIIKELQKHV